MDPSTIEQLLQQARRFYAEGRFDVASELYGNVLQAEPNHAAALAEFGFVCFQMGQHQLSCDALRRAASLNPNVAIWQAGFGQALSATGDRPAAIAAYQRALQLNPNLPDVQFNLGHELASDGQTDRAIAAYRAAIDLRPGYVEAMGNLANALCDVAQFDQAIVVYHQTLSVRPDYVSAWLGLGNALSSKGEATPAMAAYEKAVALAPNLPEAHFNLANALKSAGQNDAGIAAYERTVALRPDYSPALNNLSGLLEERGELEPAMHYLRAGAEARSLAAHNNLIYSMHFHPGYGMPAVAAEQYRWRENYAAPLIALRRPHQNDRAAERRLRIGYVSPHFRNHPVGRFMLPLLRHHDHKNFEIVVYSDIEQEDAITQESKSRSDLWRSTTRLSDAQLARQIRDDRIDLLMDLTLHMHGCRLLTFVAEPAPVQMTYLAYCSTSGLDSMHYRLTDPILDPPGDPTPFYSERSVHLRTYWCYPPPHEAPAVNALPALANGQITFGCLNNYFKVNSSVWSAWYEILRAVPSSRLIVYCPTGSHRQKIVDRFIAAGLAPDRLEFAGFVSTAEHFRRYHAIDIALDTFPYGGGTTTCDALWMGVPVVTFAGEMAVSRGSKSILTNLGLPALIGASPKQYIQIAVQLASDLPRLVELRATLRQRLLDSPLTDGKAFACGVEYAFRSMWRQFIETGRAC